MAATNGWWRSIVGASAATVLVATSALLAGCGTGIAAQGSFDRTYTVNGPIRLDLANASGAVRITGSGDNKVHVHGEIRARSLRPGARSGARWSSKINIRVQPTVGKKPIQACRRGGWSPGTYPPIGSI